MFSKILWFIRALFYKPFLGSLGGFTYLGKPLYIKNHRKIFIGSRVRIYPSARLEVIDDTSSITIEDNVSIGQGLHVVSGGKLVIMKNTTISANVLITNVDHNYHDIDVHIMEQSLAYLPTIINENCFIGYGAIIQSGTSLGKQCVVGANAVVKGVFPPYCVIGGVPAKILKRFDIKTNIWRKTNSEGKFINE